MKPSKPELSEEAIAMVIVLAVMALLWGISPAHAGAGWGNSTALGGAPIQVPTYYANSPIGMRPDPLGGAAINTGTVLRKFVDTLPGLGAAGANNLGQYIPVAVPEKWVDGNGNVTNDDYYEIAVVEYEEKMHSDLFKATRLRGYVQLSTANVPGKRDALTYPGGAPILDSKGAQVFAVDNPHYLGPLISATRGVAVRIKYTNYLPVGAAGAFFLPVDKTLAGAGVGPDGITMYTENRADIHWHGGDTPWISDGTPHQWITPAGETGAYSAIDSATGLSMGKGSVVQNVPDMPDPGPGSNTLYFPNNLSGRFMFYHDHTFGLTRINVYAGMAAGYLVADPVEQGMITSGVLPAVQIPLVIQDKTFVPKDIAQQDAKWDTLHWGQEGDLWFPHVYETNQDPNASNGINPVGRWDWGPLFWPVSPAQFALPTGVYGDVSTTPEAFMDTPVINGTAYPTLTVDPKAYRFRILNAANDRSLNLSLFVADPTIPALDPVTGLANPGFGKEVKMLPALPNVAFPPTWPTDNRDGGVPDPALAGPDIIQIGNEGGILPHPVIIKPQPVTYTQASATPGAIPILNVLNAGLYLGGAERADVVIDFSKFAGKTLILYNDAPAPNPAFDSRYDYYTGDADQTGVGGAYSTLAGYGPNIRTMMQIQVAALPPAAAFNVAALQTALPAAYGQSQGKPIVPESAYNTAFGSADADNYVTSLTGTAASPNFNWTPTAPGQVITAVTLTGGGTGYTTAPTVVFNGGVDLSPAGIVAGNAAAVATATINPVTGAVTGATLVSGGAGYTSAPLVTFTGGGGMGATASVKTSLTQSLPVYNKAITEQFDSVYGRVNATLAIFTNNAVQPAVPLAYIDPATDTIDTGETQIWRITHNGVDTHPVHLHKLNFQVINRITWNGIVMPPSAGELGWKDTVKMNPSEDIVVAVRAKRELIPFGLPRSVRPLDPHQPLGSTLGFTQVDLTGNPTALPGTPGYNPNWGKALPAGTITNAITDFDNEYVWHCHILGHEENDFMRAFVFHPYDVVPDAPRNPNIVSGAMLTWADPTPTVAPAVDAFGVATPGNPKNEIGFKIMRSANGGAFTQVGTVLANATSWTDATRPAAASYSYQVDAYNATGISLPSNTVTLSTSLSTLALTYPVQWLGINSATRMVMLTNTGNVAMPIASITITGANAADFTQNNTCGMIPPAGSCVINVTFKPGLPGTRKAALTVADAAGTKTVTLNGKGVIQPPWPNALEFRVQTVGSTSAPQKLTLTNPGTVPLPVTSIAVKGVNLMDFAQTNDCGTSVPVTGSCTISVVFTPTSAGARKGTLTAATLTVVNGAAIRNVTLKGVGTATPWDAVTPATLPTFAAQAVATSSVAQTLKLTNTGAVPLPVTSISISGANMLNFSQTNSCGTSVKVGKSCTISVVFTPSAPGINTATLTVIDAATTRNITLNGTGL